MPLTPRMMQSSGGCQTQERVSEGSTKRCGNGSKNWLCNVGILVPNWMGGCKFEKFSTSFFNVSTHLQRWDVTVF
eukprot:9268419-Karenia_brevis.AAC.1